MPATLPPLTYEGSYLPQRARSPQPPLSVSQGHFEQRNLAPATSDVADADATPVRIAVATYGTPLANTVLARSLCKISGVPFRANAPHRTIQMYLSDAALSQSQTDALAAAVAGTTATVDAGVARPVAFPLSSPICIKRLALPIDNDSHLARLVFALFGLVAQPDPAVASGNVNIPSLFVAALAPTNANGPLDGGDRAMVIAGFRGTARTMYWRPLCVSSWSPSTIGDLTPWSPEIHMPVALASSNPTAASRSDNQPARRRRYSKLSSVFSPNNRRLPDIGLSDVARMQQASFYIRLQSELISHLDRLQAIQTEIRKRLVRVPHSGQLH